MEISQKGISTVVVLEVIGMFLVIFSAVYFGFFKPYSTGMVSPSPSGSETYQNDQYGFRVALPQDWHGYSIMNNQWEGRDVTTGKATEHGPEIVLRHPRWTAVAPYEDMPIMVFTPAQWDLVQKEKLAVGAAPIPPSELGHNSSYIFALPARYNYAFPTGFEEVESILQTKPLVAF